MNLSEKAKRADTTPLGLTGSWAELSRVASLARQPWAGGHNPFGIDRSYLSETDIRFDSRPCRPYRPWGFGGKLPAPALVGLASTQAIKLRAFSPKTLSEKAKRAGSTPLGLTGSWTELPRVASLARQPWAGGRNPFGIDRSYLSETASLCGRAGSPLHAVVGIDKPDRLLHNVVGCESCDGAHGVTRPTKIARNLILHLP